MGPLHNITHDTASSKSGWGTSCKISEIPEVSLSPGLLLSEKLLFVSVAASFWGGHYFLGGGGGAASCVREAAFCCFVFVFLEKLLVCCFGFFCFSKKLLFSCFVFLCVFRLFRGGCPKVVARCCFFARLFSFFPAKWSECCLSVFLVAGGWSESSLSALCFSGRRCSACCLSVLLVAAAWSECCSSALFLAGVWAFGCALPFMSFRGVSE